MTRSEQRLEIPLDKSKIALMLFGALAFVAIGLWFVIAPPVIRNSYWGSPAKVTLAGYGSILFFGICAFFFIRKLRDNRPGLIIDDTGVVDNSGGLATGLIPWADIQDISILEIHRQKLIMLRVKDPQQYIVKQKNLLKRKGMELNNRMYGTPLSISVNGLKISLDSLLALMNDKIQASREKQKEQI